jgi:hypothetical protein
MFHPRVNVPVFEDSDLVLTPQETAEINLEIASNSYRWLFERSDRKNTKTLIVPPAPKRIIRQEELTTNVISERIFWEYRPTRWWRQSNPPAWPVSRWWSATEGLTGPLPPLFNADADTGRLPQSAMVGGYRRGAVLNDPRRGVAAGH